MYCSKCGTKNDDNSSFCFSCGSPLRQAVPPQPTDPQMPAPPMAVPRTGPVYVPKQQKPYRAEFTLGLVGAIVGAVIFAILAILSVAELLDELYIDDYDYYAYGMVTVSAVFCLASFILGFIGSSQINNGNLKGGVLLIIGSGISLICMFFSPYSFMTLLYWPLLLAGGITALARRATLQKSGEYPR